MDDFRLMPVRCARASELVSLRLDDEASEFELAMLEAHLAACSRCEARARSLESIAGYVRLARLEPPSRPVRLPRRTLSHSTTLSFASAAAALVLTIAAITLAGALGRTTQSAEAPLAYLPTVDHVSNADLVQLRVLRRAQLHLPETALNSVHIKTVVG
jgi:predicted anti-sigma-YlaC factor YlaD